MTRGNGPTGGPFAVIESDPATFTPVYALGIHGLQVTKPRNDDEESADALPKKKTSGLKMGKIVLRGLVCGLDEQRHLCVHDGFEWASDCGRGRDLAVRELRTFRNETEIDVFAGMSCIHPFICRLSKHRCGYPVLHASFSSTDVLAGLWSRRSVSRKRTGGTQHLTRLASGLRARNLVFTAQALTAYQTLDYGRRS